jgi:Fe-S cluster assembly protein SufD
MSYWNEFIATLPSAVDQQALKAPHARAEAWRYFPLRQLLAKSYSPPTPMPVAQTFAGEWRLVWIDGSLSRAHSSTPLCERVESLEVAHATPSNLADLTRLCAQQHRLQISKALQLDAPLHLHWYNTNGSSCAHLKLQLEAGVALTVVEHVHAASHENDNTVAHNLLEVELASASQLSLLRRLYSGTGARLSHSQFRLADLAKLRYFALQASNHLHRHELLIEHLGAEAQSEVRAASLSDAASFSETRLELSHQHAHTRSSCIWKSLASARSRQVFNGRIAIAAGAEQTDAQLQTANMLLSATAEIDTKPELEIYADDVKAAHGATVGQIDQAALFYLRSRGLPETEARALLLAAFVRSVFDEADGALSSLLEAELPGALSALR